MSYRAVVSFDASFETPKPSSHIYRVLVVPRQWFELWILRAYRKMRAGAVSTVRALQCTDTRRSIALGESTDHSCSETHLWIAGS